MHKCKSGSQLSCQTRTKWKHQLMFLLSITFHLQCDYFMNFFYKKPNEPKATLSAKNKNEMKTKTKHTCVVYRYINQYKLLANTSFIALMLSDALPLSFAVLSYALLPFSISISLSLCFSLFSLLSFFYHWYFHDFFAVLHQIVSISFVTGALHAYL